MLNLYYLDVIAHLQGQESQYLVLWICIWVLHWGMCRWLIWAVTYVWLT